MTTTVVAEAQAQGRPTWPYEPLYLFLREHLPAYRTESGILDIVKLAATMQIVDESIYKWFRKGRLSPRRVRQLHALIVTGENQALLDQANIPAPGIETLYEFCD